MDIAQQGLQIHLTKDGRSRETRDRKYGKECRKGRKAGYTGSGMKTKGLKVVQRYKYEDLARRMMVLAGKTWQQSSRNQKKVVGLRRYDVLEVLAKG